MSRPPPPQKSGRGPSRKRGSRFWQSSAALTSFGSVAPRHSTLSDKSLGSSQAKSGIETGHWGRAPHREVVPLPGCHLSNTRLPRSARAGTCPSGASGLFILIRGSTLRRIDHRRGPVYAVSSARPLVWTQPLFAFDEFILTAARKAPLPGRLPLLHQASRIPLLPAASRVSSRDSLPSRVRFRPRASPQITH